MNRNLPESKFFDDFYNSVKDDAECSEAEDENVPQEESEDVQTTFKEVLK